MAANLNNGAAIEDDDAIHHADAAKTVGDQNGESAFCQTAEMLKDQVLLFGVE